MQTVLVSYLCRPVKSSFNFRFLRTNIAEVAHLVEHDLAKVGVAGSSPVFRSNSPNHVFGFFFTVSFYTLVAELVDALDLKSSSPKKAVRVQLPSRVQQIKMLLNQEHFYFK